MSKRESWMDGAKPQPQPWPHAVGYDNSKHASHNAHKFLVARAGHGLRLICSDKVLYNYKDGIWHQTDDDALMWEIRQTDREVRLDVGKMNGMVNEIKVACRTPARPFDWIKRPRNAPDPNDLILCANGMYDIKSRRLLPLTPDYFATGLPEWVYDPFEECPHWLAFIADVLHADYLPTLKQWFGYMLTPDMQYQKMASYVGETRGGKGTTKDVLEALVGKSHVASIMMNDLGDTFGLEPLMDKRMLTVPDATDTSGPKRPIALERIKSITGNDGVSVNRKNIGMLTNVHLHTKLNVFGNSHMQFIDESKATAGRQILFMFEKSFYGKEDTGLGERLRGELSGIANWAIDGLRELRAAKKFTIGAQGEKQLEQLMDSQAPSLRFAKECLDITGDPKDMVPYEAMLYPVYKEWANEEGLKPSLVRNRNVFRADLKAAIGSKGVAYVDDNPKQVKWLDPHFPGSKRRTIRGRIIGVKLKRRAHPNRHKIGESH